MSAPRSTAPSGPCSRRTRSPFPWPSARSAYTITAKSSIDGAAVPIDISEQVAIPDEELEWKFIRSSGPGGQNVNKVSSAVQLRFLLSRNTSISAPAKNRLRRMAGQRLVDDGTILISARDERSQAENRRAALERLADLVRAAL